MVAKAQDQSIDFQTIPYYEENTQQHSGSLNTNFSDISIVKPRKITIIANSITGLKHKSIQPLKHVNYAKKSNTKELV